VSPQSASKYVRFGPAHNDAVDAPEAVASQAGTGGCVVSCGAGDALSSAS
jgi:hypothetical protein